MLSLVFASIDIHAWTPGTLETQEGSQVLRWADTQLSYIKRNDRALLVLNYPLITGKRVLSFPTKNSYWENCLHINLLVELFEANMVFSAKVLEMLNVLDMFITLGGKDAFGKSMKTLQTQLILYIKEMLSTGDHVTPPLYRIWIDMFTIGAAMQAYNDSTPDSRFTAGLNLAYVQDRCQELASFYSSLTTHIPIFIMEAPGPYRIKKILLKLYPENKTCWTIYLLDSQGEQHAFPVDPVGDGYPINFLLFLESLLRSKHTLSSETVTLLKKHSREGARCLKEKNHYLLPIHKNLTNYLLCFAQEHMGSDHLEAIGDLFGMFYLAYNQGSHRYPAEDEALIEPYLQGRKAYYSQYFDDKEYASLFQKETEARNLLELVQIKELRSIYQQRYYYLTKLCIAYESRERTKIHTQCAQERLLMCHLSQIYEELYLRKEHLLDIGRRSLRLQRDVMYEKEGYFQYVSTVEIPLLAVRAWEETLRRMLMKGQQIERETLYQHHTLWKQAASEKVGLYRTAWNIVRKHQRNLERFLALHEQEQERRAHLDNRWISEWYGWIQRFYGQHPLRFAVQEEEELARKKIQTDFELYKPAFTEDWADEDSIEASQPEVGDKEMVPQESEVATSTACAENGKKKKKAVVSRTLRMQGKMER